MTDYYFLEGGEENIEKKMVCRAKKDKINCLQTRYVLQNIVRISKKMFAEVHELTKFAEENFLYHPLPLQENNGPSLRGNKYLIFSIFQLPIMHFVWPPNFAYTIVLEICIPPKRI